MKYKSVAHIRWELPFPLSLPPEAILCWEPKEGLAAFVVEKHVGSLIWKRNCDLLSEKAVLGANTLEQDSNIYPRRDYRIRINKKTTKEQITISQIRQGITGGFDEARPYTIANVFLCIAFSDSIKDAAILKRANEALNNVISVFSLLSLDPLVRLINEENDHYYTLIAEAVLPVALQNETPSNILMRLNELQFRGGDAQATIIGINSFYDFIGQELNDIAERQLMRSVRNKQEYVLFHQLIFSSLRRLKRKEAAIAIIDAQSAFESAVASMLKDGLAAMGWRPEDIESSLINQEKLLMLNRRLKMIDKISRKTARGPFLGSEADHNWRTDLYDLRNRIVHGGIRTLPFVVAKKGIVSGLKAIEYLGDMSPEFRRHAVWTGQGIELPHIQETAGRLSRLFEL